MSEQIGFGRASESFYTVETTGEKGHWSHKHALIITTRFTKFRKKRARKYRGRAQRPTPFGRTFRDKLSRKDPSVRFERRPGNYKDWSPHLN